MTGGGGGWVGGREVFLSLVLTYLMCFSVSVDDTACNRILGS